MDLKILRSLFHTPVVDIIVHLKHSPGMTVRELAALMKMSYMGVKQHCTELEKKGYLDTFRRALPHGRPEKLYRLTGKLDPLFPTVTAAMMLEMLAHAERIFGLTAPEKLLHTWFQGKAELWALKLDKETTLENKALILARLRSADGHMCMVETGGAGNLRLVDYHQPLADLLEKYTVLTEIESDVIERLLGHPIERAVEEHSGLKQVIFRIRR
jgi:predicted ArsR family transcriptional regulator